MKQKIKAIELLQDLIMFTLYIVLLYTIILSKKDSATYFNNNAIRYLLKGEFQSEIDVEKFSKISE